MYESFFGFKEKPFNMTPDPRFLYMSRKHREALARLVYGVTERKGFVVLSGEVGTGKTSIARALLARLDQNSQVAYVFNPRLSMEELLKLVCHDLGIEVKGDSKIDYVTKLHDFLIKSHHSGKTTTLIIDEAQNLDASLFEEIRMLTNFETASQKLLQILLVGQPELDDHLERAELWQLKQRIAVRYHLLPLDLEETREYIRTRIGIAGVARRDVFTEEAVQEIYRFSMGIPRMINNICDNSLLIGYITDQLTINKKMVQECASDLQLEGVSIRAAGPVFFGWGKTHITQSVLRRFRSIYPYVSRQFKAIHSLFRRDDRPITPASLTDTLLPIVEQEAMAYLFPGAQENSRTSEIRDSLKRTDIRVDSPVVTTSQVPAKPIASLKDQKRTKKRPTVLGVKLTDLIQAGLLKTPLEVERRYKKTHLKASIQADGKVIFDEKSYDSLSRAAGMARKSVIGAPQGRQYPQTNGWTFWQYHDSETERLLAIDALRQRFLKKQKGREESQTG